MKHVMLFENFQDKIIINKDYTEFKLENIILDVKKWCPLYLDDHSNFSSFWRELYKILEPLMKGKMISFINFSNEYLKGVVEDIDFNVLTNDYKNDVAIFIIFGDNDADMIRVDITKPIRIWHKESDAAKFGI